MGLTMSQRKSVTKASATRSLRAGRAEKKLMVDELCESETIGVGTDLPANP
jgi:hypothetical protein